MAAAATDLTSLATLKAYMYDGTTIPTGSDVLLQRLLSAASLRVADYLAQGAIFNTPTSVVATYGGNGTSRLLLNRWPATAVASVVMDGVSISRWIPGQGLANQQAAGFGLPGCASGWTPGLWDGVQSPPPTCLLQLQSGIWTRGTNNIVVTFTAGFTGLAGSGAGAVPFDLEQAVIELVTQSYKQKSRLGLASEAGPGGETASGYIVKMLPSVKEALAPYRRVVPQ